MKNILSALVLLFSVSVLYAQNGSLGITDAYSTAMGKTYTISSRGIYAVGINPANLALDNPGHWEIGLPSLGVRTGTNFLSIDEFNYFFGGVDSAGTRIARHLTDDDKQRMRNLFAGGGDVVVDVNTLDLGFSIKPNDRVGAFAFTIQDYMTAQFTFPSGVIDLALSGNPLGSEYSLDDMKLKMSWLRSYNLSWAHDLSILKPKSFKQLTFGIGLKYVQGFAYVGLESISTKIKTNQDYSIFVSGDMQLRTALSSSFGVKYGFDSTAGSSSSSFSIAPQTAGSGFGFDIGFSAIINDRWSVGVAITDIGSVKWKTNTAEYSSHSSFTLTDLSDSTQRDSLANRFKGDGKFIDAFSTKLPTTLRIGTMWIVKPEVFMLNMDINAGLNDAPRNDQSARFSIGGNWNAAKWLPYLRGGFSWGGAEFFSWTVGIGFSYKSMEFNAATPDFQYIFTPKDGKRISFAASWRLKFD